MPIGVYLFVGVNLFLGLPAAVFFASMLTEFSDGGQDHDVGYRFCRPAVASGFAAAVLLVALGARLLIPPWKRSLTAFALGLAAATALMATAALALSAAFLGHSGGLREAFFLVLILPIALVLLAPTLLELWYLRRPYVRQALDRSAAHAKCPDSPGQNP